MERRALVAWAWTTFLLLVCLLPARFLPIPEEGPRAPRVPHLDKLVHLGLFAGFGLLWMRVGRSSWRGVPILVGGCLLAVATELGQALPAIGRDADVFDALADVLGVAAGVGLARLTGSWRSGATGTEAGARTGDEASSS